jgi:hypothetical protein
MADDLTWRGMGDKLLVGDLVTVTDVVARS